MTSVQKENCVKAVLVIDLPKDCWDCHLVDEWGYCDAIKITSNKFDMNVKPYNNEKPSWCPLKPLPRKKYEHPYPHEDNEYAYGWNSCLKEIEE